MTQMTQQEAFNTIKKVVDLSLQNGVIKSIEESKIVFDSLETLYKGIEQQEKRTQGVKQNEKEEVVIK
tara:strand:+ start:6457 stop:6660 length:204 start_codon:yes stop_codon:yes gene_type:complete